MLENGIKYARSATDAPEGRRSGARCCILRRTDTKLNRIKESTYRCGSAFSSKVTSTIIIILIKANHSPEELICSLYVFPQPPTLGNFAATTSHWWHPA